MSAPCPIAKRLGKRAEQLLATIATYPRSRVFWYSELPPGWSELERRSFATRDGERATITEVGLAYVKAWLP